MDGDILTTFSQLFGVNPLNTVVVVPLVVMFVAIFKEQLGLQGRANMIVAAILAIGLNCLIYWPAIKPIIVGSLICWGCAVGGWAAVKQAVHKVGTPSTHTAGNGG
jgi:hypothetical protein